MINSPSQLPLISTIIPIYNSASSLKCCVDSVIAQTYTNLEIILLDDGSTDGSGEICDEYALHDNRIVVVHKKNGGTSDTRTHGLRIASGQYITFVDHDDYIMPSMYMALYDLMISENSDISMCSRYIKVDNAIGPEEISGREFTISGTEAIHRLVLFEEEGPQHKQFLSIVGRLLRPNPMPFKYWWVWNKLYKADIVKDISFSAVDLEDLLWNLDVFDRADRISVTTDPYYVFCIHNESQSHRDRGLAGAKSQLLHFKFLYQQIKLHHNEFLEDSLPLLLGQNIVILNNVANRNLKSAEERLDDKYIISEISSFLHDISLDATLLNIKLISRLTRLAIGISPRLFSFFINIISSIIQRNRHNNIVPNEKKLS
jgi:glycosyltransferase involved in cell wall biosynthesis